MFRFVLPYFFSLCVFAGIYLSLILIMIVLVHVCFGFPLQFYSIGSMIDG